jgi:hypothetical protein
MLAGVERNLCETVQYYSFLQSMSASENSERILETVRQISGNMIRLQRNFYKLKPVLLFTLNLE